MGGLWSAIKKLLSGQDEAPRAESPFQNVPPTGDPVTCDEALELIDTLAPERLKDPLRELLRPAIAIETGPVDESEMALGASKLGGQPDLPAGAEWPHHEGKPLSFIAQIRLQDVAGHDTEGALPASGLLQFFYDAETQPWGFTPDDRGSWAVLYTENETANLQRRASESGIEQFAACALTFSPIGTLPCLEQQALVGLKLSTEEEVAYLTLAARMGIGGGGETSWLLGHSDNVQGDMQLECQLVSHRLYCGDSTGYTDPRAQELKPGAAQWRLLAQFGSDDNAGMMWGDMGMLYYWIREDDLASRNFAAAWVILQCG